MPGIDLLVTVTTARKANYKFFWHRATSDTHQRTKMEICRSRARQMDWFIASNSVGAARQHSGMLPGQRALRAPFPVDNKANKIPPEIKIGNLGDRRARPAASHALKIPGPTSRQTDRTNEWTNALRRTRRKWKSALACSLARSLAAPDESEIFAATI